MLIEKISKSDKLLKRFNSKYKIVKSGCWEWQKYKNKKGYGTAGPKLAHRISYELFIGEIPNGMLVCHECDNPGCVNPFHLFIGTYSDNLKDCFKKGRRKKLPIKHPSLTTYRNGCRCEECQNVALAYQKKYTLL